MQGKSETPVTTITNLINSIMNVVTKDDLLISNEISNTSIWEELLNCLDNEDSSSCFNHYPLWESDFEEDSLIDYIQESIDLYDLDLSSIVAIRNFWNESVAELGELLYSYFEEDNEDKAIPGAGGYITFKDIYQADAGNSFNGEKWVIAWQNYDGDTYSEVRGDDKVLSVLNSDRNLQFTRDKSNLLKPFIRLIMPKYTRRVEVEDLNRDFWVIAQTITGISAFLFDDDGLSKILRSLLNELIQIWENLLYLWAELFLENKKEYPVRVVFLPRPNNSVQHYMKYDNFTEVDTMTFEEEKENLQFLADKYPDNCLVIVPFYRKHNYEHNYYKTFKLQRIIFYDRYKDGDDRWSYIIPHNYLSSTEQHSDNAFVISLNQNYQDSEKIIPTDSIYGVTNPESYGENLYYFKPLSAAKEVTSLIYYGAVRIVPDIEASYDINNQRIVITKFNLDLYDAAKAISYSTPTKLTTYSIYIGTTTGYTNTKKWYSGQTLDSDNDVVVLKRSDISSITTTSTTDESVPSYKRGLYLGEVISLKVVGEYTEPDEPVDDKLAATFVPQENKEIIGEIVEVGKWLPGTLSYSDSEKKTYFKPYEVYNEEDKQSVKIRHAQGATGKKTSVIGNFTLVNSDHEFTRYYYGTTARTGDESTITSNGTNYYRFYWNKHFANLENANDKSNDYTDFFEEASGDVNYTTIRNRVLARTTDKGDCPLSSIINSKGKNKIQYIILQYGAYVPWFNQKGIMYWSSEILSLIMEYIPKYKRTTNNGQFCIYYNGKLLGSISKTCTLRVVNTAYSDAGFINNGTTWRTPYFFVNDDDDVDDSTITYFSYNFAIDGEEKNGYILRTDLESILGISFTSPSSDSSYSINITEDQAKQIVKKGEDYMTNETGLVGTLAIRDEWAYDQGITNDKELYPMKAKVTWATDEENTTTVKLTNKGDRRVEFSTISHNGDMA